MLTLSSGAALHFIPYLPIIEDAGPLPKQTKSNLLLFFETYADSNSAPPASFTATRIFFLFFIFISEKPIMDNVSKRSILEHRLPGHSLFLKTQIFSQLLHTDIVNACAAIYSMQIQFIKSVFNDKPPGRFTRTLAPEFFISYEYREFGSHAYVINVLKRYVSYMSIGLLVYYGENKVDNISMTAE